MEKNLRYRVAAGPLQGVGLCLAASLGDGLGKVGEQDSEPEPDCDLSGKGQIILALSPDLG